MSESAPLITFVLGYWRPHLRIVLCAGALMLTATVISAAIPLAAKEILTFDGLAGGMIGQTSGDGSLGGLMGRVDNMGAASEWIFGGVVSCVLRLFFPFLALDVPANTITELNTISSDDANPMGGVVDEPFLFSLLCRCALLATLIASYHFVSLLAHLTTYRAGMSTQASIIDDALRRLLSSPYPERMAVVDPTRVTNLVLSSAKTSCDILGALLTDVLINICNSVNALGVLLLISPRLTLIVGGLVGAVQLVYLAAGRHHDRLSAQVSKHEAGVAASFTNAVRRSETIRVFNCRDFVLHRMAGTLDGFRHATDVLNLSIHGYAAVSTASTTLLFVVVLGLCNYYHRKGELALEDVAMFFLFLHRFVQSLVQLATDASRTWATMGRLRLLQRMLQWFSAAPDERARHPRETAGGNPEASLHEDEQKPLSPRMVQSESADEDVRLVDVTFTYPAGPSFLREGADKSSPLSALSQHDTDEKRDGSGCPRSPTGVAETTCENLHHNGIHNVTLTARAHKITALYGPSGCGKSTCLRLLAGLLTPQGGTVHTQRRAVLLEQDHAIFLGSVAENILLEDVPAKSEGGASRGNGDAGDRTVEKDDEENRRRIARAMAQSRCVAFLSNPYEAMIDNVDKPPFSGGQLQRICLARVFARGSHQARRKDGADAANGDLTSAACSLVLLDEPTTGLDAATVGQLLATLTELRDVHGMTVLISTHDERVAAIADEVFRLG